MGSEPISIQSSTNIFQWILALITYNRHITVARSVSGPYIFHSLPHLRHFTMSQSRASSSVAGPADVTWNDA